MEQLAGTGVIVNQTFIEVRVFLLILHFSGQILFGGYPKYKQTFGKEQAMKILQNEKVRDFVLFIGPDDERMFPQFKETLALLTQVVEEEKIECDLWRGRAFGSWSLK